MAWLLLLIGCDDQTFPLCPAGPIIEDGDEVLPGLGQTSEQLIDAWIPERIELTWDAPGPLPASIELSDPIFARAVTAECRLDWYAIDLWLLTDVLDVRKQAQITLRQDGSVFERTFSSSFDDQEISRWAREELGLSTGSAWFSVRNDQAELVVESIDPGAPERSDYPDSFHGTAAW